MVAADALNCQRGLMLEQWPIAGYILNDCSGHWYNNWHEFIANEHVIRNESKVIPMKNFFAKGIDGTVLENDKMRLQ